MEKPQKPEYYKETMGGGSFGGEQDMDDKKSEME